MKKFTVGLASATVLANLVIGAGNVFAAEYPEDTRGETEAKVTILENDEPDTDIPDPDNPDGPPLVPDNPDEINPGVSSFKIGYISNFDFGDQKNSSGAVSLQAKLVGFQTEDGTAVQRVPFVTTVDNRGTDRTGWSLRVSQPNGFLDADNNELKGASLKFSNVHYATNTADTPTATQELTLNAQEQDIAKATTEQGMGTRALVLGEEQEDGTTNGVTLDIPANTVKNNTEYRTKIVWEFVADPTDNVGDDNDENTGDQE